jgi:hypothetical protein
VPVALVESVAVVVLPLDGVEPAVGGGFGVDVPLAVCSAKVEGSPAETVA